MTATDLKDLREKLQSLLYAMTSTAVAGMRQQAFTEAVKTAVNPAHVQAVITDLEHAYGLIALKGATDG